MTQNIKILDQDTRCMQEYYECQDEHQEHFEDHDEHQEHIFEKFLKLVVSYKSSQNFNFKNLIFSKSFSKIISFSFFFYFSKILKIIFF